MASCNGLGWRVWKKSETSKWTQTDVDEQRFYAYEAGWQLLEERIDTDLDASIERVGQQVWGVRYIDDAVAKRLDRLNDGSWDASYVYLTDAQFSVRALAETSLAGAAEIVERVAYTPYGEARHRYAGDMDGDGDVDAADISAIPGSGYVADLDADHDGSNADDTSGWLIPRVSGGLYAAAVPDGWLSDPGLGSTVGTDNSIGYAGYVADFETEDYHVRFRRYQPTTGRWYQRDPIGYSGGSTLYEYVVSSPSGLSDPLGLNPRRERSLDPTERLEEPVRSIVRTVTDPDQLICLSQARSLAFMSVHNTERVPEEERRWWDVFDPTKLPDRPIPGGEGRFKGTLINGPGDAVRHCTWNCMMSFCVGTDKAREIADAYEELHPENEPDGSREMDLHNNQRGRDIFDEIYEELYGNNPNACNFRRDRFNKLKECDKRCKQALDEGRLKTLEIEHWRDHDFTRPDPGVWDGFEP